MGRESAAEPAQRSALAQVGAEAKPELIKSPAGGKMEIQKLSTPPGA